MLCFYKSEFLKGAKQILRRTEVYSEDRSVKEDKEYIYF